MIARFRLIPLMLLGLALAVAPLPAQAAISLTAGVFGSTALVKDGVVSTTLKPTVAPGIGLGVAFPISSTNSYRLLLQADVSHGNVTASDEISGESSVLTSLTTVDATAMIDGTLREDIRWQLGAGRIFYVPGANVGVFQSGTAASWLLAAGLTWHHPLTPTMRLIVAGRVDYHAFTTDELTLRGYAKSQSVERFGLHLGVERNF